MSDLRTPAKGLELSYVWDVGTYDGGSGELPLSGVLFPGLVPSEYGLLIQVVATLAGNAIDVEGSLDGTTWFTLLAAPLTGTVNHNIDVANLRDLDRVRYPYLRVTDDQNGDPGDVTVNIFARRIPTNLNRY